MPDEPTEDVAVAPMPAAPEGGTSLPPSRFPGILTVLLTAAFVIGGFYIATWAARYLTLDPAVYGSRWDFALLVFLHVLFGIYALLIGPFQFWSGMRRYNPKLHRRVGRTYVAPVAASVTCAVTLLIFRDHSINFRLGIGGLSLAWTATTGLAYVALRRRLLQGRHVRRR